MKPFVARWALDGGEREVTVIAFMEGDAVVVLPSGTLERARLKDLRVERYERPDDWPEVVLAWPQAE